MWVGCPSGSASAFSNERAGGGHDCPCKGSECIDHVGAELGAYIAVDIGVDIGVDRVRPEPGFHPVRPPFSRSSTKFPEENGGRTGEWWTSD